MNERLSPWREKGVSRVGQCCSQPRGLQHPLIKSSPIFACMDSGCGGLLPCTRRSMAQCDWQHLNVIGSCTFGCILQTAQFRSPRGNTRSTCNETGTQEDIGVQYCNPSNKIQQTVGNLCKPWISRRSQRHDCLLIGEPLLKLSP